MSRDAPVAADSLHDPETGRPRQMRLGSARKLSSEMRMGRKDGCLPRKGAEGSARAGLPPRRLLRSPGRPASWGPRQAAISSNAGRPRAILPRRGRAVKEAITLKRRSPSRGRLPKRRSVPHDRCYRVTHRKGGPVTEPARREYAAAMRPRYRRANNPERGRILDAALALASHESRTRPPIVPDGFVGLAIAPAASAFPNYLPEAVDGRRGPARACLSLPGPSRPSRTLPR
jgi:hypothetical protein